MTIFFEIFHTIWPYLFKLGVVPIWIFFIAIEALNKVLGTLNFIDSSSSFLPSFFYSLFFVNALIFIENLFLYTTHSIGK